MRYVKRRTKLKAFISKATERNNKISDLIQYFERLISLSDKDNRLLAANGYFEGKGIIIVGGDTSAEYGNIEKDQVYAKIKDAEKILWDKFRKFNVGRNNFTARIYRWALEPQKWLSKMRDRSMTEKEYSIFSKLDVEGVANLIYNMYYDSMGNYTSNARNLEGVIQQELVG